MDGPGDDDSWRPDPARDERLEELPEMDLPGERPQKREPMPVLGLPPRAGPLPPRPKDIQRVKLAPKIPGFEGEEGLPAKRKVPPPAPASPPPLPPLPVDPEPRGEDRTPREERSYSDTVMDGQPSAGPTPAVSRIGDTAEMYLEGARPAGIVADLSPDTLAPSPTATPVGGGEHVFGRFTMHGRLGQGGMGEVWLATDGADGSTVALKRVRTDLSEEARRRLRLEVEALSRLDNPRICAVRDWGNEGGVPWFSMEALEGRTLADRLNDAAGRPLPLDLTRKIAASVVEALAAAHAAKIVHRDLKPENVFLCNDGGVKLLDFGIAKVRDQDSGASLYGTQGGRGRFTPQYMAPEQATKRDAIGPATDLYALGVMLFELLAGRLPFESATQMGFVTQHLGETPPPLSRFRPGTPAALDALIARLLEKRPHDRFDSAESLMGPMVAALDEAAQAEEALRARLRGARSGEVAAPLGGPVPAAPAITHPQAPPPSAPRPPVPAAQASARVGAQPAQKPYEETQPLEPAAGGGAPSQRVPPPVPPAAPAAPPKAQGQAQSIAASLSAAVSASIGEKAAALAAAAKEAPPRGARADDVAVKSSYRVGPFVIPEDPAETGPIAAPGAPAPPPRPAKGAQWEASEERKEEYARAALSLGQDKAELHKLTEVHRDLERPLRAGDDSPFSFSRTCGLSAPLLDRLEGKSLGDALVELALKDAEIEELKELGRVLTSPRLSEATRRSGKIVFALASARGLVQKGPPQDPAKARALRDLILGVRDKGYVVERYRKLLDKAFERLSPAAPPPSPGRS